MLWDQADNLLEVVGQSSVEGKVVQPGQRAVCGYRPGSGRLLDHNVDLPEAPTASACPILVSGFRSSQCCCRRHWG
jgi:hypothetical protein